MKNIIGVDEVGRGSLAGPVTVGAVLLKKKTDMPPGLKDSKKLSPGQRENWFRFIRAREKEGILFFAYASVSPSVVDRLNISRAANLAAFRAIRKVMRKSGTKTSNLKIFLDRGLKIPSGYNQTSMIKADEKIPVVSMASIAAKVSRDAYMIRASRKYPGYGFEFHKGYGTDFHRKVIRKKGPLKIHRLTFLGGFSNLKHITRRDLRV